MLYIIIILIYHSTSKLQSYAYLPAGAIAGALYSTTAGSTGATGAACTAGAAATGATGASAAGTTCCGRFVAATRKPKTSSDM